MDTILTLIVGLIGTVIGVILTKVTESYFDQKKEAKLFIADSEKIIEWGWNGKKLLRHLIALDYETTDNLNESNEGTAEQWAPVFMNNPDCWKLLALREAELVGYWCFFPIRQNLFDQLKNGSINDSEITEDTIDSFERPRYYNIYIVIICIKEHYRKMGFKLLFDSMIDKMNELNRKGFIFKEICVNEFTEEGKILSKNFGLSPIAKHKDFGTIYLGTYENMKISRLGRGRLI